jgi:flap endonuclease-1
VVDLKENLIDLGVTREQLVEVGILIGTDYNPDGVKGVGPKTALKLIKEFGSLKAILARTPELQLPENSDRIREFFLKPDVRSDYALSWSRPNVEGVVDFLCRERDFSEDRVRKAVDRMETGLAKPATKPTLERYFG